MKIPENPAEFKKLIDLLRNCGVQSAKIEPNGAIEVSLNPVKPLSKYKSKQAARNNGVEAGETQLEQYTDDQILFWSAGQIPPTDQE